MKNVFEQFNKTKQAVAFKSQAIASDTTTAGEIIDTAGFTALMFLMLTKAVTDGDYVPLLQHGDESDLSDAATVPAADVIGQATSDFLADTDDDTAKKIAYVGGKRYVRLNIVSTNVTTGVDIFSGIALLGGAMHAPPAAE